MSVLFLLYKVTNVEFYCKMLTDKRGKLCKNAKITLKGKRLSNGYKNFYCHMMDLL
ncbi:hypothetical protein Ga0466249_001847 [Sporomusaceae bacterium BoRhaA]|nr:hypothetical protein [Pelorhabdus rhamnosifermentans]